MSYLKLKDRISSYEDGSNYRLLPRVPLIINLNGKSFHKSTSLLKKPFSDEFAECMNYTMMRLVSEIEGSVFAYCFSDDITVVVRNDQNIETMPWFDNRLQKICSISSSIATLQFNNCISAMDLNVMSDGAFFTSNVFTVPNISEAVNTIILKQQKCHQTSVHNAAYYNLIKKYSDKNDVKEILSSFSMDEKINILKSKCDIDYDDYSVEFRRGSACYRVPKIYDEGNLKYKWEVNKNLPSFQNDHSLLSSILKNGVDVIRTVNI